MHWQITPGATAVVLTAVLAAAVGALAWRRRSLPGAAALAGLMAAVAWWSLANGLEKAAVEPSLKIFFAKLQHVGIASVAPLWFMFALAYTQRRLSGSTLALLWIMPVTNVVMAATNERHGWLWRHIEPSSAVPGAHLIYDHGTWFWVFSGYSYLLLIGGTLALALAILRFPHVYGRQAAALLVGATVPWLCNFIYLIGASPVPGLDLTPFAFTFAGALYGWSIFRFQLLDLVPVARDAVVESMSDGVIVLDAQDRLADINAAAQRLIGMTGDAPIGAPADHVLRGWPELVSSNGRTSCEVRRGTDTCLDVRTVKLADRHGATTGRLIMLRDVSERARIDQLRDDWTRTIVHDLRNPLASVSSALEILKEEADSWSDVQREMTDMARRNASRMFRLVNAFLDVERLESGRMPLQLEPVRLDRLVAALVELQGPRTEEKQLDVVTDVPENLSAALVDSSLIERVLENLFGNAIAFTPIGGRIRVSARAESAGGLLISVSDTGPGVPPDLRDRLFQKFASGQAPGRGSGLGLAFCRLAVEAHGGSIWLDSEPGAGTTVSFTVPVAG